MRKESHGELVILIDSDYEQSIAGLLFPKEYHEGRN